MRIVLVGPPGVGKGTQAVRLAERLQVPHLSSGDLLRDACQRQTDVGLQAAEFMQAGKLVPDELILSTVFARLAEADCRSGCLLDGFPRNQPQAEQLDEFLAGRQEALAAVIVIQASEQELFRRLADRGRLDDSEEVIRKRLVEYDTLTRPLVDYYRDRGILQTVDGEGSPDEVFTRIQQVVAGLQK